MNRVAASRWFPVSVALAALVVLAVWLRHGPATDVTMRVPGTDQAGGNGQGGTNAVLAGKVFPSDGQPATNLAGAWPGFRGANRDGISAETTAVLKEWSPAGPRQLWSVDVGDGYAGATVLNGRVYVMDYDRPKHQDALRCLSLADGKEIWRFAYPVAVKRNHGMSRTVPAVTPKYVVAMGPKCHALCVDAQTGELRWGMDLVRQYGAQVPPWYTGQCPLIDRDAAILAPGGRNALLLAVDCATGTVQWQTPNPQGWKMTHSSVMPMEFAGQRMYVYCANNGVVGVSAKDGSVLWQTSDWKISLATVPSPAILPGGRIFLSGGYNAGSLMLQLKSEGNQLTAQTVYRLKPEIFGATQHTPVFYQNHLFGVRADGLFVCLDENGRVQWTSDAGQKFGLGSFLLAGGTFFVLNDSGELSLIEASPTRFHRLARAPILSGHESWGPMAFAGGRLIARDLTRMVCLEVANR